MSKKIRKWKIEFEFWDYGSSTGCYFRKKILKNWIKSKLEDFITYEMMTKIKNLKIRRSNGDKKGQYGKG